MNVCMFLEVNRIEKNNFQSVTLELLYQVKLNIARQNGYTKQNINLLHFLAKLINCEEKTFCTHARVLSVRIQHHGHHANNTAEPACCRTETSKTKHSRKHITFIQSTSFGSKIQTKLLPRATLIQLSDVCLNHFEDCLATLPKGNMKANISKL